MVNLKAEVTRLRGQLEDAETARASAVTAAEAVRDAAVDRQEELSEDLRRARQAAERLTVSEEDAVIAVEKDMRAKHEREVAVLQERASKAEARVRERERGGGDVCEGTQASLVCVPCVFLGVGSPSRYSQEKEKTCR